MVTDVDGVLGVAEHLHRYALACEYVKNKIVLDLASGEGYGSHILSKVAQQVTGVDISAEAVSHANKKYARGNGSLVYKEGSASKIPLEDASVDVVTSFETLEHTTEQREFLLEIKRVLKPGGVLIMSTPDTEVYKEREPDNPFHVKELSTAEFKQLIESHFNHSVFFNQRCSVGCFISPIEEVKAPFKPYYGTYEGVQAGHGNDSFYGKAFFNIAFASDSSAALNDVHMHSFFQHVPDLLNEFKGARGLMFELQETKKLANRLHEIEKSQSYKLAQKLSKLYNIFR